MKKILFIFLLVLLPLQFTSCGSDEPESTTFTVNYMVDNSSSGRNTVYVELILCGYDDHNEKVSTNHMTRVNKGSTNTFVASEKAETIKVRVRFYSSAATISNKWVQTKYNLKKGGNIQINIENNTVLGIDEP